MLKNLYRYLEIDAYVFKMDVPEYFESLGWFGELLTGILPTVILNNRSLTDLYAQKKRFYDAHAVQVKKVPNFKKVLYKRVAAEFHRERFLGWVALQMYYILAAMIIIILWCQRDLFIKIPQVQKSKSPICKTQFYRGDKKLFYTAFKRSHVIWTSVLAK